MFEPLKFNQEDMKGVRVTHVNGFVEDYDPVVSIKLLNGVFSINNTFHTYVVPLSQVRFLETYDRILCTDQECEDIAWFDDVNFKTIWKM